VDVADVADVVDVVDVGGVGDVVDVVDVKQSGRGEMGVIDGGWLDLFCLICL
jgi:hypothetical protein